MHALIKIAPEKETERSPVTLGYSSNESISAENH